MGSHSTRFHLSTMYFMRSFLNQPDFVSLLVVCGVSPFSDREIKLAATTTVTHDKIYEGTFFYFVEIVGIFQALPVFNYDFHVCTRDRLSSYRSSCLISHVSYILRTCPVRLDWKTIPESGLEIPVPSPEWEHFPRC